MEHVIELEDITAAYDRHGVSIPSGSKSTKSAAAEYNARLISSSEACLFPARRFSRIVPLSRLFPCGT